MGISVLSSAAAAVPLSSGTPTDVSTAAGSAGAANQAARGDHAHRYTHPDSGWLTPALQNGWQVYDTLYGNAAMYRKIGNIVFLRGLVKNGGAGTVIFTLPAGYRPSIKMLFGVDSGGTFVHGRVDVDAGGNVIHVAGDRAYFQISCSFVADG